MANSVGNLFTKYSATYSRAGEDSSLMPLTPKELKKASRNELRGLEGDVLRVSKRGGNFLDRVMCWIEDRVFSLTRSGHPDSSRQSQSKEFSEDVKNALTEIGVDTEGVDEHQLMKQIKSVQVRDLPLRSGFVQSILREVASLENASGSDRLPDIAKAAFSETDTGSPAQASVYQEDLLERDSEPEQVVTNTSDNSHGEIWHETPVYGDESVRNDPKLSSETVGETHKADEKDDIGKPSGNDVQNVLQTPANDVTEATNVSAGNVPSKKIGEREHQNFGDKDVTDEESPILSLSEVESTSKADEKGDKGKPSGNDAQNVSQTPPNDVTEATNVKEAAAAKEVAKEAYLANLEGTLHVSGVARDVIVEEGYDLIRFFSYGRGTPLYLAYCDHMPKHGNKWRSIHKQVALDIYSDHYDKAAEKGDILLDNVKDASIKEFDQYFKHEFEVVVREIKAKE